MKLGGIYMELQGLCYCIRQQRDAEVYARVFLFPSLGKEIRETKHEEVAAEGSVGTDQREIHYPEVTGHTYRM